MIINVKHWIKENIILIIAFVVWLVMEFMIQSITGDELSYQTALQVQSLSEYITYYLQTWSNRILIDAMAVIVLSKPMILFKVMNAIVFFFLIYGMKKMLLVNEKDKSAELFLVSLFFVIPYACFLDAGFSVTCIYYLWPVTAGVWSIHIVKKEKCSWVLKVLGVLLLIFSCNMEQTALLMNSLLFLICCFNLKKKERRSYLWLTLLLAVGCITFMLCGEGGNNRVLVEIRDKFPEYIGLTVLQKFDMGFSTTMRHLLMECDLLWILFVALLFLGLSKKGKVSYYILGAIPLCISLVFGLFKESLFAAFPNLTYMMESVGEYGVIDLNNYDLRNRWVTLLFFMFVLVTVIVDIYLLEENLIKSMVLIFIFVMGFLSRLIMGFSPTIYASGNRTYYPFWIVLIGLIFCLYQIIEKKQKIMSTTVIIALISICNVVTSFNR